jgi:hypothetical protein
LLVFQLLWVWTTCRFKNQIVFNPVVPNALTSALN